MNMNAVSHTLAPFTCLARLGSPQRRARRFASMNNEEVICSRPRHGDIKSAWCETDPDKELGCVIVVQLPFGEMAVVTSGGGGVFHL